MQTIYGRPWKIHDCMIKKTNIIIGCFVSLLFSLVLLFHGYIRPLPTFSSELGRSLAFFYRNESQHKDPVKHCLYDAGDYLVFIQRNTEALALLSYAYTWAKTDAAKHDLIQTIDRFLPCSEQMFSLKLKQFRDQSNHGVNLPPIINEWLYPQNTYSFEQAEGRDVAALLFLIEKNMDKDTHAFISPIAFATASANCCEGGTLILNAQQLAAIDTLLPEGKNNVDGMWGLDWRAISAVEHGDWNDVKRTLTTIQERFKPTGEPFLYPNGNKDIAGTVALERLYARATGDKSFETLSHELFSYLHGKNVYKIDFTNSPRLYHPCQFFHVCTLQETLVNGADEHGVDVHRPDIWKNTEPSITTQATYVIASLLYFDL